MKFFTKILKDFSKIFQEYFKNIPKIFPQKQSKSRWVWFVLSHLHPLKFFFFKPNTFQLTIDVRVVAVVFRLNPSSLM
jgi:hypothetical protein